MSSAPVPSWKVSPPTGWVIEAMKGGVSRGLLSLGRGIEGVECFEVMANNEDTFIVGRGEGEERRGGPSHTGPPAAPCTGPVLTARF